MLLLQYGNMGKELTRYNTKLFAEQVMPKLRDVHAGWTDHWWPQPMTPASVPRSPPSCRSWRPNKERNVS